MGAPDSGGREAGHAAGMLTWRAAGWPCGSWRARGPLWCGGMLSTG